MNVCPEKHSPLSELPHTFLQISKSWVKWKVMLPASSRGLFTDRKRQADIFGRMGVVVERFCVERRSVWKMKSTSTSKIMVQITVTRFISSAMWDFCLLLKDTGLLIPVGTNPFYSFVFTACLGSSSHVNQCFMRHRDSGKKWPQQFTIHPFIVPLQCFCARQDCYKSSTTLPTWLSNLWHLKAIKPQLSFVSSTCHESEEKLLPRDSLGPATLRQQTTKCMKMKRALLHQENWESCHSKSHAL